MTQRDLAHVLHSFAVYFVLAKSLTRETFLSALGALEVRAERAEGVGPEQHWGGIRERMSGKKRWDAVSPRYEPSDNSVDEWRKQKAAVQSIENILRLRRFAAYTVAGLRYTLDVFNPANELDLPYRGAGETVVALLVDGFEREPGPISNRLAENQVFYQILNDLDGILNPEHVCGDHPNTMFSVLWAYLDGRVAPDYRPWEFMHSLQLLNHPPIALTGETRISGKPVGMLPGKEVQLAKVEDWGRGRVLIQVMPGLNAGISWEYFAVAHALGMVAVQQLHEGAVPPRKTHDRA